MNIGIVGSRRRNTLRDKQLVKEAFEELLEMTGGVLNEGGVTIVSGGCPQGADKFAEELADEFNFPIKIHYPDKSKDKKGDYLSWVKLYHDRNTLVANDSDYMIACVASDRKGGTEDTVKKFLKKNNEHTLILV